MRDLISFTIASIVYAPAVFFLSSVIILATIGKSFGIRKLYVQILLWVFEVSQVKQICQHVTGHKLDQSSK